VPALPPASASPLRLATGVVFGVAASLQGAAAQSGSVDQDAASLAEALIERAAAHNVNAAWIDAHMVVSPSSAARERWVHLLRPFGPTDLVLGSCHGSTAVVTGPDYVRVVLECRPALSLVIRQVDGAPRIAAIEPTACTQCDERSRFVVDLIADVRREGELGEHLKPDFELVPADRKDAGSKWESWSALEEARLRADHDVAATLAGAEVVRVEDETVILKLPDGDEDTWHIVSTPRGWAVVYDDLAGSSPLRLSTLESRRWKKASVRQEAAVQTWTPVWRALDGGVGTLIGHHALSATFDPADEVVVAVLLDREVPYAAVAEVDPSTNTVLRRWNIPLPDGQDPVQLIDGIPPERVAFDPTTRKVALAAFGRIWVVDRVADSVREVTRAKGVTALSWSAETNAFVWIGRGGVVSPVPSTWRGTPTAPDAVGVLVERGALTTVGGDGVLTQWWPPPPTTTTAAPPPAVPPPEPEEAPQATDVDGARPRPDDAKLQAEELTADDEGEASTAPEADSPPPDDVEGGGSPLAPADDVPTPASAPAEPAAEDPKATAEPASVSSDEPKTVTAPAALPEVKEIPAVRTPVCPSSVAGATRSPTSGHWLVVCGPGDRQSYATIRMPGALVEPMGDIGSPSPAAAWSTSTSQLAVPAAPEIDAGIVIWDQQRGVPWTVIGRQRPVSAAFSADGSQLITTDIDGALVLWDLALAHRRFPVPVVSLAEPAPTPAPAPSKPRR
jgi:hypothetical protein